jgi:glycosyltransferase involved in cell wall biosynthesis
MHERLWAKISGKPAKYKRERLFQPIFAEQPDLIILSEGAFANVVHFPELSELVLEHRHKIPFSIIVQQNKEFGMLPTQQTELARDIYLNAQHVFFVSERNKQVAEYMLSAELPHAEVVRYPVNLKKPDYIAYNIKDPKLKLASVSRLECKAKGQDLLLRALSLLKEHYDFELTFYGKGPDEENLKRLTKFLGLEEHVVFAGFTDSIEEVWKEHQLLVMPSHYEGIPLAVAEAMLCGRPCLLTDVAGNTEWISHGENGFIAESPTVKALVKTLEDAFKQNDKWQAMGKNAAVTAKTLYDPQPGETLIKRICH